MSAPRMLQLLNAFLTVQALHVAARLRIPDLLAGGAMDTERLAAETGAHAPSLDRLLRLLCSQGVLREEADGRFALTALGATLQSDAAESVRDWALFVGDRATWEGWGRLHEAVMTGTPGFVLAHGVSTYEYFVRNPELGAAFARWMTRQSEQHNAALLAAYDFSAFRTVADIGGGEGSTLAAILAAHRAARGILLDVPEVVAHAAALRADDLRERCRVIGGDMLEAVPVGADAYLLKRVLMIWGDENAVQVLRNCAAVLPPGGKILVVEMILPPANEPGPAAGLNVLMMLAHGGRVRTEAEFRRLAAAAGLEVARIVQTDSPNSVLDLRKPSSP